MEPRPSGRGNQTSEAGYRFPPIASMEPRPSGRGNATFFTLWLSSKTSFNGATAEWPWKPGGVSTTSGLGRLQWSHGRVAVETAGGPARWGLRGVFESPLLVTPKAESREPTLQPCPGPCLTEIRRLRRFRAPAGRGVATYPLDGPTVLNAVSVRSDDGRTPLWQRLLPTQEYNTIRGTPLCRT